MPSLTKPAEAPPASGSRFTNLDALRGIASLSVALFHFTCNLPETWFKSLCSWGWMGVDIFFVISGFILPCALQGRGNYRFPDQYPRFLWKRILRLHPPYLVTVVVVATIWYTSSLTPDFKGDLPGMRWSDLAAHPFLLNDILGLKWLSGVFWTLAIEFQFYLLIGLVFPLLAHRKYWVPVVLVFIAGGVLPVSRIWIVPFMPVFAMGILTWKMLRGGGAPWLVILLACAAALSAVQSVGVPVTLLSLGTALAIIGWRKGVPRWLIWTGTVSYSLYLLHTSIGGMILGLTNRFPMDEALAQILAVAAALAVSLVAALLLFYVVERPALQWSSRKSFRS
ncbi:MAG TPA: acyltransferase [Verrucomicrobiales bacterium]|nr:acyltransferase [Verrucomicrobiales bacterium]